MMGNARLAPMLRTMGFCLVGVLVQAPPVAAEQSWLPVVVQTGLPQNPHPGAVVPPAPRLNRARAPQGPAPADKLRDFAPDTGVIRPPAPKPAARVSVPETVGAIDETRALSEADKARLKAPGEGEQPAAREAPAGVTIPDSDLARRYCVNVADAAADARIAFQKAKLAEAEQEISKRIAALEAKTAEYKQWLQRRDEFSRKVNETLVQIYAQMEPDAAALQLVAMDEETAAAVLTKLDPRSSGAILNEMQPERAARLTGTMAGAARVATRRDPAAQAAAARAARAGQEDDLEGGER